MNPIQTNPSTVYNAEDYKARLVIIRKSDKSLMGTYDMTQALTKWQESNTDSTTTYSTADTIRYYAHKMFSMEMWNRNAIRFFGRIVPWTIGLAGTFIAARYATNAYLTWDNSANADRCADALFLAFYVAGGALVLSIDKAARKALKNSDPLVKFAKDLVVKAPDGLLDALSNAGSLVLRVGENSPKVYLSQKVPKKPSRKSKRHTIIDIEGLSPVEPSDSIRKASRQDSKDLTGFNFPRRITIEERQQTPFSPNSPDPDEPLLKPKLSQLEITERRRNPSESKSPGTPPHDHPIRRRESYIEEQTIIEGSPIDADDEHSS